MNGKIFVDTNVLVYAYDRSAPEKQRQALAVLDHLIEAGTGVISAQVLGEFFVTVTRKIVSPLSASEALERIQNYLQACAVLDMTGLIVLEAARGVRDHSLNFWDAQIWAAARLNQISVVFSEDFSHTAMIEGVYFLNPFAENFRLEEWA